MLNVVLECLRFAYTFIEVVLNYISKPSHLINTVLGRNSNYVYEVPRHISLVYADKDAISLEAACNFLIHCSQAGIRKVTLYDPWSFLYKRKRIFQRLSEARLKKHCSEKEMSIAFDDGDNFYTVKADTVVRILGGSDGRQSLVRACKKLCSTTKDQQAITAQKITECLFAEGLTEPDFLLHVGNTMTMAGYPPWNLRVTELHFINRLSASLSYEQFLSFLSIYSSKDRRFGR